MKEKIIDNAIAPIIAIDFDGTINVNGEQTYPICGSVRKYAKEVINFMHNLGIKVVIWTSRDIAYNQDDRVIYDHLTPMLEFLDNNDIHYDAINKSIQFAPYYYNGRKVYAHMYVDDRSYGWEESEFIMIDVLRSFLKNVCGFNDRNANVVSSWCRCGNNPTQEMIDEVAKWKD